MVGFKSARRPIRGVMAKKMHEHVMRLRKERESGVKTQTNSPIRTSINLTEVNDN